jgi:damage-control phosphatase, subfamily III
MLYDAAWEPGTPFEKAIGAIAHGHLPPFAMLRTNKSETVAGVSKEKIQELDRIDKDWRVNGKFGMIQYFQAP